MDRSHVRVIAFILLLMPLRCLSDVATTGSEPGNQSGNGPNAPTQIADLSRRLSQLSLSELQEHLISIDAQLRWLAPYSLRSGVGVIGFRSAWRGAADRQEWIEVALGDSVPIDEIVLVPTLWRDSIKGFRSDGFPRSIRVLAGTDDDRQGKVVATYDVSDKIEPRTGPLVVSMEPTLASWVRIEATKLSKRAFDNKEIFQLAEVLVFSDMQNVALRQSVTTSSHSDDRVGAWDSTYLVDGLTPYLMDSAQGSQSLAYVSRFGEQPVLSVDLGSEYPISGIHLHAVDQDDTVPQAHAGDLGIPNRLLIEGASDKDFTDAKTLLDYQRTNVNDIGPTMMWRVPETKCRFVRLSAIKPSVSGLNVSQDIRIGFAEIELFAKGENVARDKRAFANSMPKPGDRSLRALTDGRNLFGDIPPLRTWINQLAKRHDLEGMRPLVVAELNQRYARQRAQLTWVTWLAAFLAFGIGVTFLLDRIVRMRQLAELRSRFAADLHDELGADLHVISLLSDLSRGAIDNPQKHESLHQRIRIMTQRSSDAVRYCTNMLEAKELYGDLLEDMQRSTDRIMADFEGELSFDGDAAVLRGLKPRTRADLFLFYKECLVNISRHSDGTHFDARLTVHGNEISLTVRDDGRGLDSDQRSAVPSSLKRRAKLLGADAEVQSSESDGTTISLKMKTRKWRFRK
ncbi:MAG: ATP-binding protein [Rubripirellula sp.]